jgi:hypothetical protein
VRHSAWLFPEPRTKSDAVFSESCDLDGLYASWAPEGHLRMTLKREAVLSKLERQQLKKPTVFDGMLSPLWQKRELRQRSWGTSERGLREALTTIDWQDVDPSKWVCVQVDAKHEAILRTRGR